MNLTQRQLDNFFAKIGSTHDCWLWEGARTGDGYASFRVGSKIVYAHRVSYELFIGPIPDELEIDHLCRVRHCICPTHLEPVTGDTNIRRGGNAIKTHCPQGHEYNIANTYLYEVGGRQCKTCVRGRARLRL